jgi:hypothetical protein
LARTRELIFKSPKHKAIRKTARNSNKINKTTTPGYIRLDIHDFNENIDIHTGMSRAEFLIIVLASIIVRCRVVDGSDVKFDTPSTVIT